MTTDHSPNLRKSMSHGKEDSPQGPNELSARKGNLKTFGKATKKITTRQKIGNKMASLRVSNHLNFNLNLLESEPGENSPE